MDHKDDSEPDVRSGAGSLFSAANSPEGLMSWEVKAHPHPTLFMDISFGVLTLLFGGFYLYGYFHDNDNTREVVTFSAPVPIVIILIFWIGIVRQKKFYTYRITEAGGTVDYWLHFSKHAAVVFKSIAIFVLGAVLAMISIMPMMIFALVGVGAITLPAALKLLAWENEIDHESFDWVRVQLIFTDRKRSLVILQRRYDPDIPFEQNYLYFRVFLPRHRVDEFLETCRKHAPANVDFEEGKIEY